VLHGQPLLASSTQRRPECAPILHNLLGGASRPRCCAARGIHADVKFLFAEIAHRGTLFLMQLTDKTPPSNPDRLGPSDLRSDPSSVISAWLSELKLVEESTRVYFSMLGKFSAWLARHDKSFESCKDYDIRAFLDLNGLEKEHRYRYVRLIERFYIFLAVRKILNRDNPGSRAAKEGIGLGHNDNSQFLSPEERDAVVGYISAPISREGEGREEKPKKPSTRHWSSFEEWRESRDRALVAITLFGSVKVSELGLLSVNCITWGGDGGADRVRIPAAGRVLYHEAILLPEGRAAILNWLAMRKDAGIQKDRMFPASDIGDAMHATSIYRRVHHITSAALEQVGLDVPEARLSPQTLRNSYAAILIERGFTDQEIMNSMGIEWRSMARLRTNYKIAQTLGG